MQMLTGTSGYSYKEWLGSFYPEKFPDAKMLEYYSARFTTVEVNYARTPAGDLPARLTAAVGLLAAALVLYLVASRGQVGEWLARWPHACGVAVGIAWWLFLAPSVLGLVLVAVSVLGAFRSPWKTMRTRQDPLTSRAGAPRPVAR